MGLGLSIVLFFLLPMIIGSFFDRWLTGTLALNLVEGIIRMVIFMTYMVLVSRMNEMKRVFSYHGAEHKTIRCYEAGLPLTVENVRGMTRLHPRCGTSFLLVVMVISILVFSVASSGLLALIPALEAIRGSFGYRLLMIVFKLMLLPVVVGITYEINRWCGRNDNALTRAMSAPGMWLQNFTTNEPDDSMIEVPSKRWRRFCLKRRVLTGGKEISGSGDGHPQRTAEKRTHGNCRHVGQTAGFPLLRQKCPQSADEPGRICHR